MKKLIFTSALILSFAITTFAQFGNLPQQLRYDVRAKHNKPVKKEMLTEAKLARDIISGYPENWITSCTSLVIMTFCDGKTSIAASTNEALSAEQKKLLSSIDLGADVAADVKYKYKNPVTHNIEDHTMHVLLTLVPDKEAEYIGGYADMKKYLDDNGIKKISELFPKKFQGANVRFIINEQGEITNAKIFRSSGDPQIDKLFLDAITKMPKWKPAENHKGIKVKQEFELTASAGNEGC